MRLTSISIENYRSITKAYKIPLGDLTVLVGPNNEGKSNILLALVTAMDVLTGETIRSTIGAGVSSVKFVLGASRSYDWSRDFPIPLQSKRPKGETVIVLEFGLADDELAVFQHDIRTGLSGTLPIRIALGPQRTVSVSVHKKGPGAKALSQKAAAISSFIAKRIRFEHIPAVRTASSAEAIVERLVARELQTLEQDSRYQAAVTQVAALQDPLLKKLSASIKSTLVQFLPEVQDVTITVSRADRFRALRQSCSIVVNDGTPTALQFKGDGAQSLAALGIMRHASDQASASRAAVIAIEEPESHLHPSAIHTLREVIDELSSKYQVVLSTHSPVFVERSRVESNILVSDNRARPAKSVPEIRDVLGVRASDNLTSAAVVLVVEGEDDRKSLAALLAHEDPAIAKAIHSGYLAIDSLCGASNLAYKLGQLRTLLCRTYCFLDNDRAALDAAHVAASNHLLTAADITHASCPSRPESELEDLYEMALITAALQVPYGVSLAVARFRNNKKFSVRVRETFRQQGKTWDSKVEADVKRLISEEVVKNPAGALCAATRGAFDALVASIRALLGP